MLLKLAVLCSLFQFGFLILEYNIIFDYTKAKSLNLGTIFSCQSKKTNLQLARELSKDNLRFYIINLEIETKTENIEKALHRNHNHLAVIVDGSCPETSLNFLTKISGEKRYFHDTHHWLFISETSEIILSVLKKSNLNINCDVNMAIPLVGSLEENLVNESFWLIYDLYNPAAKHHGQLKSVILGNYSKSTGYQARMSSNKYWVRRNLTGIKFKSAIVVPNSKTDLQEYLTSQTERQKDSMHRFQSSTINHCKAMFNFSLDVIRTNSWGYIQKSTGRFDGLVRLLEDRKVDFGSSPLIYKLDRMPVVGYSFGNWILRSAFIYRKPKIRAKSYEIFLRPLEEQVWWTIVMVLAVVMICLKLTFRTERVILQTRDYLNKGVDPSWSFLILFTLGAFCQQGATCYPRLIGTRILSVFVFLFCILVYDFYSASIVSYLLMDPPRTIYNVKDLLHSSLRAGIEDILIDRDYFVQTTNPADIALYYAKIHTDDSNDTGFYEPHDGLEMVKKGGFAFHVETSTAYPIIEDTFTNEEICELEEVQMYRTQPMHTNLQKNSPFIEMFNFCMLKMLEDGKMNRLRKYWDARKPTCIESAKKITINVTIHDFSIGLIVLSYGILISLTSLVIEYAMFYRRTVLKKIGIVKDKIYPFTN